MLTRSTFEAPVVSALSILAIAASAGAAVGQAPPSFLGTQYPTGATSAIGIVAGDFNGDGLQDFAGGQFDPSVPKPLYILLSGGGTYTPVASPPSLSFTTAFLVFPGLSIDLLAADLNHDGALDLAVSDTAASVQLFLGNSAGGFIDVGLQSFNPGGGSIGLYDIRAADVTGDGIEDLLAAAFSLASIGIRAGTPQGTLAPPVFSSVPGVSVGNLDLGDFNGDGVLDYATASANQDLLAISLGAPGGGIASTAVKSLGALSSFRQLVAADLDGDGRPDLVFNALNTFFFVIASQLCDGQGGFSGTPKILVSPANTNNRPVVGDFNADGSNDVAYTPTATTDAVVLPNLGNGTFAPGVGFTLGAPDAKSGIVATDLDGDGRIDLGVSYLGTQIALYRNTTPYHLGLVPFGVGTHGCNGIHGINTTQTPRVGGTAHRAAFTNAPPRTLGLGLASDIASGGGSDPFGLGIDLLVGVQGATELYAYDIVTDLQGNGVAQVPIPNFPWLAGKSYVLQGIFLATSPCLPSPYGLSTSRGLVLTIQP